MTAAQVSDFTEKIKSRPELSALSLHRIYYYDAEPLGTKKPIPLTGGRRNWKQYDFSVTPLHLVKPQLLKPTNTSTSLTLTNSDLIPNIQQKGSRSNSQSKRILQSIYPFFIQYVSLLNSHT